ncbi:hypothetical protein cce_2602 [Crocosphaera subtropica ATCC 51142]|uniref:Uncharacterized protein n=1 Tax=Crocosphaera subtropica (strain ATCC 51142 / BH68) TaxID=43989 RepID=B1WSG4_CROS5|nr:hypothetical protein [Crocosphaera subtropica]ACB51950.1 hypothetical protein cce_2602 [Crocosphaera subtropica ATCC 51142]
MKVNYLSIGFWSIAGLIFMPSIAPQSASAQCVQSHTGVQLHMGKSPAEQTQHTQFDNQGNCTGNASSTTATQVNIGGNNVRQHQEVRHETRGSRVNSSRVNGPTVSVDVVTPVNVQTPNNFPD